MKKGNWINHKHVVTKPHNTDKGLCGRLFFYPRKPKPQKAFDLKIRRLQRELQK